MNSTISSSLLQLLGYLKQDPHNSALMTQAFETALACGELDQASLLVSKAREAGMNATQWQLREAHLAMARRDWATAEELLMALDAHQPADVALSACVAQDRALIALHTGKPQQALEVLRPWVTNEGTISDSIQSLWMRALHRAELLEEALNSAAEWQRTGHLGAQAQGVASLIALDAGQADLAESYSTAALRHYPRQTEALISHGTLALGAMKPAQAKEAMAGVFENSPNEGRAWSVWAYAELLEGQAAAAMQSFAKAMHTMKDHIGTWQGLGWAAWVAGDLDEAEKAFAQALAMDRNFAESQGAMAAVMARRGQAAQAREGISLALKLDPNCMSAHYAQAILDGKAQDQQFLQSSATQLMARRRLRSLKRS